MIARRNQAGVSLLETLIVMALMLAMAAISLPKASGAVADYRFQEGLNALAAEVSMAKLKAVSQSNRYQVDFSGNQAYQLDAADSTDTAFTLVGGTEALALPVNITYGFGAITAAAGDSGEQTGVSSAPVQSAAITFNSLGLPVDSSGSPLAQNAVYLTDGNQYGAVTVSLSGRVQRWYWLGSSWIQK